MPGPSTDKTVPQADFERMSGATREHWRRWTRRKLVSKPKGSSYSWKHVVQALVLYELERVAGADVALRCWADVRGAVESIFPPKSKDPPSPDDELPVMDLVVDPGTSPASKRVMRAYVSHDARTTLELVRAAETPAVIDLAPKIRDARLAFELVTTRLREHSVKEPKVAPPARKVDRWA